MLPIIGTLLSSGLGLLANVAKEKGGEWIKEKTGIDINKGSLSEEDIIALKKYELDHEEELQKIALENRKVDLEETKAYLADTGNARNMQVEALKQDDIFAKRFVYYYAIGITSVFIIYIFSITFSTIPESNIRFADTILGFLLGTVLSTIINFFYGSSKSSKEKTEALIKGGK